MTTDRGCPVRRKREKGAFFHAQLVGRKENVPILLVKGFWLRRFLFE